MAYISSLTLISGSSYDIKSKSVTGQAGTTDAYRHVWFSDSVNETARNYDDDLKYNPSKNSIKLGAAYITYNSTDGSIDFTFD